MRQRQPSRMMARGAEGASRGDGREGSFAGPSALDGSESFEPHWALANAHVQTVLRLLLRVPPEAPLEPVTIPTPDDDFLELHLDAGAERDGASPVVLIVHGLEGNHLAPYVRSLRRLIAARGWGSVSMLHRSCGTRLNLTPRLYHAGDTEDLATVVRWMLERWPNRRIFVAGYSLGGNQVAKWLGTQGDAIDARVCAAATVSPPFDLRVTAPQIDRALGGAYRRHFLRTLVPKAFAKARQFPGLLDEAALRAVRTLRDYDEAVTTVLYGFRDASDFYRQSGCAQYLSGVRRPLLLLAAADDPFTPQSTIPLAECRDNRWLSGLFTRQGGHVGFVAGGPWFPSYWSELRVLDYFERHA